MRWTLKQQWVDKAGGFLAWVVFLNSGKKPVFIGRNWARAVAYIARKIKKRDALTKRQQAARGK